MTRQVPLQGTNVYEVFESANEIISQKRDINMNRFAIILMFLILSQALTLAQEDSVLTPWPSTREVLPTVQARVWKADTNMVFAYKVENGMGAHQAICVFWVFIGNAQILSVSQEEFWAPGLHAFRSGRTTNWGTILPSANILPGAPGKSFGLTTGSLPGVVYAHSLGYLGPDTSEEEFDYDTTGSDIEDNSVKSLTIGPGLIPPQNSPLLLADSIDSYVQQSRTANWISSGATANKYSALIGRLRNDIIQSNLHLARARTDTILQQANIDSSSTLTSEAYGLIRFNTEYLRDMLLSRGEIKRRW